MWKRLAQRRGPRNQLSPALPSAAGFDGIGYWRVHRAGTEPGGGNGKPPSGPRGAFREFAPQLLHLRGQRTQARPAPPPAADNVRSRASTAPSAMPTKEPERGQRTIHGAAQHQATQGTQQDEQECHARQGESQSI